MIVQAQEHTVPDAYAGQPRGCGNAVGAVDASAAQRL